MLDWRTYVSWTSLLEKTLRSATRSQQEKKRRNKQARFELLECRAAPGSLMLDLAVLGGAFGASSMELDARDSSQTWEQIKTSAMADSFSPQRLRPATIEHEQADPFRSQARVSTRPVQQFKSAEIDSALASPLNIDLSIALGNLLVDANRNSAQSHVGQANVPSLPAPAPNANSSTGSGTSSSGVSSDSSGDGGNVGSGLTPRVPALITTAPSAPVVLPATSQAVSGGSAAPSEHTTTQPPATAETLPPVPVTAAAEASSAGNADGNGDGVVNGADFLQWQRSYGNTASTPTASNVAALTLVSDLSSDFNGDGTVDGADLGVWEAGFSSAGLVASGMTGADFLHWQRDLGQSGDGLSGDFNGDGTVDGADLGKWEADFHSTPLAAGEMTGADFLQWQRDLGQSGTSMSGDINRNGTVDAEDLTFWSESFGSTTDRLARAHGVPNGLNISVTFNSPNPTTVAPTIRLLDIEGDSNDDERINDSTPTFDGVFEGRGPVMSPASLRNLKVTIGGDVTGEIKLGDFENRTVNGVSNPDFGNLNVAGDYKIHFELTTSALNAGVNNLVLSGRGANSAFDPTPKRFLLTLDNTSPRVISIRRQNPTSDRTNADNVGFRVTFSENVHNVDATDFSLSGTAAGDGAIGTLIKQSDSIYDVPVSGIEDSNGTINLDFAGSQDILDFAENRLTNVVPRVEEEYEIDNTAPDITQPPSFIVGDVGRSTTDGITSQNSGLTFEALAADATQVDFVFRNPNSSPTPIAMATATLTGGIWQATFPGPIPDNLPNEKYDVVAIARDALGNTRESPSLQVKIDTQAPVAPSLALNSGSDSGAADGITNDTSPAFDVGLTIDDAKVSLLRRNAADTSSTPVSVNENVPSAANNVTSIQSPNINAGPPFSFEFFATQTDLAGNESPRSSAVNVVVDTTPPDLAQLALALPSLIFADSNLPVVITDDATTDIISSFDEQQFIGANNIVTLQLCAAGDSGCLTPLATRQLTIPALGSSGGAEQATVNSLTTLDPTAPFATGDNSVFVRATDAAGNSADSASFSFFVSNLADATAGAPNTPVYSTAYKINEAVDENGNLVFDSGEDFFPWQMGFDNKTQTIFLTMEQTNDFAQFDPASGFVRVFDLAAINTIAGLSGNFEDPHGAFFDFNSHLTPRAWFVHRANAEGNADPDDDELGPARLSYLDVTANELVTYDFADDDTIAPLPTTTAVEMAEVLSSAVVFHAVFVDKLGDVWAVSLASNTILQFDFEEGTNLNSRSGKLRIHRIPDELSVGAINNDFEPHALEVVVDDKTGDQYVWFIAEGGSGRIGLLRPGSSTEDGKDEWHTWDIDSAEGARGTFVKVDDNETPGVPQDDKIVGTFPVVRLNGTSASTVGIMYELDPDLENHTAGSAIGAEARLWKIPNTPGTATGNAGANQPFIDRAGEVYAIDRLGGILRFHPDELPAETPSISAIRYKDAQAPIEVIISPTRIEGPAANADNTAIDLALADLEDDQSVREGWILADGVGQSTKNAFASDRSTVKGLDQYELAGPNVNLQGRGSRLGPFRGAINATNVLYGSLARNGMLSTTVFAETARRQMAVVPSPTAGNMALRGRMVFQTLRDGSVILTARTDGSILDKQENLSFLVSRDQSLDFNGIKISGDVTTIVDSANHVHVFGKNFAGNLVRYEYSGAWGFGSDLFDTNNWNAQVFTSYDGSNDPLIGNPRAFVDNAGANVSVYITTSQGKLLHFDASSAALTHTDLSARSTSSEKVYAKVSAVQQGNTVYLYGTDQQGGLVEYRHALGNATSGVRSRTITLNPGDRPAGQTGRAAQTERDTMVFQDVEAISDGVTRHVYATDGTSRLVHYGVTDQAAYAENVSKIAADSLTDGDTVADQAFGQFPFQEPFVGRVYSGLTVLAGNNGRQFIYGTNGSNLILFIRGNDGDTNNVQQTTEWRVADLTSDIYSIYGAVDNRSGGAPAFRLPANSVFGSPGGYIEEDGDRHIFQINAEGEVVEYYIDFNQTVPRFHTQNVNLRTGKTPTDLLNENQPSD